MTRFKLYTSIMGPASMSVSCITFAKYFISIFHSNEPCKMQFYEKVMVTTCLYHPRAI